MSDFMNHYGIAGQPAPEFRVDTWLANTGDHEHGRVAIADIDEPVIYLYNFQAWCQGCHSHGFPALATIKKHFELAGRAERVKFIAVQTVFEGHDENTEQAAHDAVERHGVSDVALGHDVSSPPTIMADYRTGGTPWTVIIGPDRTVLADGFQVDVDNAIGLIESILDTDSATDSADTDSADTDTDTDTDGDTAPDGEPGTPTATEPDPQNETGELS